ncbi:alpha/beta-hydrolase [Hesseltinella vesiculosa]|uniref:Alpha/beta-hydrolase n=1 Tax=Hesseltinella vesiculosa TaxID=101127 RepID=A0A1X2GJ22_9FUNG|nr:alpha/beta-hydrolase [Hesseltinella vesiculosa]
MSFQLYNTWQTLGPFPIGMREQDFGADPLQAFGGFQNLHFNRETQYPSELAIKGKVGWTTVKSTLDNTIVPSFNGIRWQQNETAFGWSIEQYQAWFRGSLRVSQPSRLLIQVHGVSSFYVDDRMYAGDLYSDKTTHHLVELTKGLHRLDVRLVHDVRVFGGGHGQPRCRFTVSVRPLEATNHLPDDPFVNGTAHAREMVKQCILPSFIRSLGFAGAHGAITLQNLLPQPMQVVSIRLVLNAYNAAMDVSTILRPAALLQRPMHTMLVSGQQRNIGFCFDLTNIKDPIFQHATSIHTKVLVTITTAASTFSLVDETNLVTLDWRVEPVFRYTFVDFDESVQHAYTKRPRVLTTDTNKPILLALHGAGVDAGSSFWTNAIAQQEHAWVVFPTGRTAWGYDWHGASMKNAFQALDGLEKAVALLTATVEGTPSEDSDWIVGKTTQTARCGDPQPFNFLVDRGDFISVGDRHKLIYLGHSNGGQGAWHLATHFPDQAIAAVPAAGYVKIQDYVSFANWVSHSYVDPLLFGILESSIAEFNNDLHLPNMTGLPVLVRYGADDDNVPPLHSKKYARILNQCNKLPAFVEISEVPNQGHWWQSVLNDKLVNQFLTQQIKQPVQKSTDTPFELVTTNPGTIGPIHGIQIEQLTIPFRKSTLQGKVKDQVLQLTTKNISAFRLVDRPEVAIMVDNTLFHFDQDHHRSLFVLDHQKQWKVETQRWPKKNQRSRQTYGPIHRLYESSKALVLVVPSKPSTAARGQLYEHLALQLAHDWHLYGHGDALIVTDDHPLITYEQVDLNAENWKPDDDEDDPAWHVFLGIGKDNQAMMQTVSASAVNIQLGRHSVAIASNHFEDPGTGTLFMCPGSSSLCLIVYGVDEQGLTLASQLIPRRTGMIIPEWVVINSVAKEQGLGGINSAGFFNNHWEAFGY